MVAKPKPTPKQKTADKPAPRAAEAAAEAQGPRESLKLKALIDTVAETTELRKKDVRFVIEATLEAMAAALSRGEDLILPPLGKARVGRTKGDLLILRLKRPADGKAKKVSSKALAEDDEGL